MTVTAPATKEFLLTIEDYYKMAEVGIIPHDARVELINGKIRYTSPINSPHAYVTGECYDILARQLSGKAVIRCQFPILIPTGSSPEPDLAIVKLPKRTYKKRHPKPKDIYLLIEIAASSFEYDIGEKLQMYALAGIPEYWVIDLNDYKIHIYRQPDGDKYLFEEIIDENGIAKCQTIDFQLTVKEIFG